MYMYIQDELKHILVNYNKKYNNKNNKKLFFLY